jgi:hypothetical protein
MWKMLKGSRWRDQTEREEVSEVIVGREESDKVIVQMGWSGIAELLRFAEVRLE